MAAAAVSAAKEILTEWETSLQTFHNNNNNAGGDDAIYPTSIQLYKLGLCLHALQQQKQQQQEEKNSTNNNNKTKRYYADVQFTYHNLLAALPEDYCSMAFKEISAAFKMVMSFSDDDDKAYYFVTEEKNRALESVTALLDGSPLAASEGMLEGWEVEFLTVLITYCNNTTAQANSDRPQLQTSLFNCLRQYVLHERDFERLLPALHVLQENDTVWNILVENLNQHNQHWRESILLHFPKEQQDYILSLLAAPGHTEEEALAQRLRTTTLHSSVGNTAQNKTKAAAVTPEQELQRRIDQVRDILPNYGEGFVEAALSLYHGQVQETVAKLLEDNSNWPTSLQIMDPSLPRRSAAHKKQMEEEEELLAKALTKSALQAVARQEEHDAYLVERVMASSSQPSSSAEKYHHPHNEYDDDYDDQYDDMDGVGSADHALYDDYDAIRTYNRVARAAEQDDSFWQENRNTNRTMNNNKKNTSRRVSDGTSVDDGTNNKSLADAEDGSDPVVVVSGEETPRYRGPDKIRGGRIPGRGGGRGGRGGRGGSGVVKTNEDGASEGNEGNGASNAGKPNLKKKARKLDKRQNEQKKAQVQKSG
jgi:CUE domain